MKEFYIAPEVEIMCFTPVEELANKGWAFYGVDDNDPATPDENGSTFDTELPDHDDDGEG